MLHNQRGFTLIELMVVVIVIGLVTAIGMANFINLKENSVRASCISNQKHAVEAALLYAGENGVGAATFTVATLHAGNYLANEASECPASGDNNFDDYTITLLNERVTVITCDIQTAKHSWEPPP